MIERGIYWRPAFLSPPLFVPLLIALHGGGYVVGYRDPFDAWHYAGLPDDAARWVTIDRAAVVAWAMIQPP